MWCVVEYEPNANPRHMKQAPPQDETRIEGFPRHGPLPSAPDGWHGLERVRTGHETNLNQRSHKPQPLRAVERETEDVLGEIVEGRRPSMVLLMGAG